MTKQCMIDLETLSLNNNAMIIAIGAVMFDPHAEGIGDTFYVAINPRDGEGHVNVGDMGPDGYKPGTVMWWLDAEQDEPRKRWLSEPRVDLPEAIWGFRDWFGREPLPLWGNGAGFDNVVLRNAFTRLAIPTPWGYKDDRCLRTMRALMPRLKIEADTTFPAHHALGDALYQARLLQAIVKALEISEDVPQEGLATRGG